MQTDTLMYFLQLNKILLQEQQVHYRKKPQEHTKSHVPKRGIEQFA